MSCLRQLSLLVDLIQAMTTSIRIGPVDVPLLRVLSFSPVGRQGGAPSDWVEVSQDESFSDLDTV